MTEGDLVDFLLHRAGVGIDQYVHRRAVLSFRPFAAAIGGRDATRNGPGY
jgi:hypothetical protein